MKYWLLYNNEIKYAVKENSWIARVAARKLNSQNVAITLGRTIYLCLVSKDEFIRNSSWLKHEMTHIRQFQKHGFFRFIFLYLIESIRHGYYNNRFEVEARAAEEISDTLAHGK